MISSALSFLVTNNTDTVTLLHNLYPILFIYFSFTYKYVNRDIEREREEEKECIRSSYRLLDLLPWPHLFFPSILSPSLSLSLSNIQMRLVEFRQRAQKKASTPPMASCCPTPTPTSAHNSASSSFFINDHEDILLEVMKRLDHRSLALASCVCRLWRSITLLDSLWENLILPRHLALHPDSLRPVVLAMGGYRKLFSVCVRPLLDRLSRSGRVVWTDNDVRLSLSLFSIDCYERLGARSPAGSSSSSSSSSLRFLCEPVNV